MDEKQIQRLRDVAFLLSSPGADYTLIPEAIQGLRDLCDEAEQLRAEAALGTMVREVTLDNILTLTRSTRMAYAEVKEKIGHDTHIAHGDTLIDALSKVAPREPTQP